MLGLDLGFAHTGMVLARVTTDLLGYEILETKATHTGEYIFSKLKKHGGELGMTEANIERAGHLYLGLKDFIAGRKISMLVAEVPGGGAQSAAAARGMALANGVLGVVVKMMEGCPFVPIDQAQTKKMLTGAKDASKKSVENVIRGYFPDYAWPKLKKDAEHVFDAAGAMIVAKQSHHYVNLVNRLKGEASGGTL